MSPITTHVLDTARGRPAAGITVVLARCQGEASWLELARGTTNADGRIATLLPDAVALVPGTYRLCFATGDYFRTCGVRSFFPEVVVTFDIDDPAGKYHVPLLLSPFGYATYRGS